MKEEAHKNADLETTTAEVDRLKAEVDTQVRLAVNLVSTLEKQRAESKSALEEQKAELDLL